MPVGVKLVHGRVVLNLLFPSESSNPYRGRAGYPHPWSCCAHPGRPGLWLESCSFTSSRRLPPPPPPQPEVTFRKPVLLGEPRPKGEGGANRVHLPQARRGDVTEGQAFCSRGYGAGQLIRAGSLRQALSAGVGGGAGGGDGGGRAREGELLKARKLTKLEQRLRAKVVPRIFKASHTLQACPQLPGRGVR